MSEHHWQNISIEEVKGMNSEINKLQAENAKLKQSNDLMTINRLRNTLQNLIAKTQERIDAREGDDSRWVAGHLDGLLLGCKFALDQLPGGYYNLVPASLESE